VLPQSSHSCAAQSHVTRLRARCRNPRAACAVTASHCRSRRERALAKNGHLTRSAPLGRGLKRSADPGNKPFFHSCSASRIRRFALLRWTSSRRPASRALAPLTEPHLLPPQWPRLKLEGVRNARWQSTDRFSVPRANCTTSSPTLLL
jgi:hypothetical protein